MRDKLDSEKVIELAELGFSTAEIGRRLSYKEGSVWCALKRLGVKARNGRFNVVKSLNDLEKSVIIGTVLGDGSLSKENVNSRLSWGHSMKQEGYANWKRSLFENINFNSNIYTGPVDKRTGKRYTAIYFHSETNECLTEFYDKFYINGKKIIPMELVEKHYNEQSLAIHFMDDGCKYHKTYSIATMSFNRKDTEKFSRFLFIKFNIESTITGAGNLNIRQKSAITFKNLIEKHIHEECRYKLQSM